MTQKFVKIKATGKEILGKSSSLRTDIGSVPESLCTKIWKIVVHKI